MLNIIEIDMSICKKKRMKVVRNVRQRWVYMRIKL